MVIDCETHVFEYVDMAQFGGKYGRTRAEDLIKDMDQAGVEKAFLMIYEISDMSPCPQLPDPTAKTFGEHTLEYFIESWHAYQDRFFLFHVTDPRRPDCIEILERLYKLGLRGLGETQPGYQSIMPNGPEFMKVYRFAAEKGLPVVLTTEFWDQFDGYFPSRDFDAYFDMYEAVIREFKDVRFMLDHGGNCGRIVSAEVFTPQGAGMDFSMVARSWEQYLEANKRCYKLAAEVDNLWICSCMPWWFQDNKVSPLLFDQLKHLREFVGFSKVCWGSDWPWNGSSADFCFKSEYKTVVDAYCQFAECTDEERKCLLGKSAYQFVTGATI